MPIPSKINVDEEVRVLVVDDEIHIVNFISDTLTNHGYDVDAFSDPEAAYRILPDKKFDLALIDINMPHIDGTELSKAFRKHNHDAEIIIITGASDEKNLDPCLKLGLTHFLFKPFNKSQLLYTVYAALHFQRLRRSYIADLQNSTQSKLVGISKSIREVKQEIRTTAQVELPVLITGESGTGKEIIAHEVHHVSNRRKKAFLPINCAILGSLAESELFGHAKGAFTGSHTATNGYVGASEGGTLFLDEIGELSINIQAKLLRFLDSGEYMRVGESSLRVADIRIVAATNRDLESMCREGTFRKDLFYRLSGLTIRTTPLHDRKEDITPLIWHFLTQFGTSHSRTYDISSDACTLLVNHAWPGNVRQLKQTLFKIAQLTAGNKILSHDVEKVIGAPISSSHQTFKQAKQEVVEDFERRYLIKTLQISKGNLKKALALSGMHKKNFYTKINNLGLFLKDFNPNKT
ncbi:sigma-54 dependent transcriptional regulator [Desulfogranum marinum]|uniref:sigma-54-dependent transcriptional regulator n=1 Tax=Desulfogranum marinum TaxID=453220 RepID=UPI0029C81E85|nr:sigma-54 dependent transcriptional regulator [Desulfogranum marinum]